MDRLLTFFGVERERDELPADVFPTGLAPFIRRTEDGSGNKRIEDGNFGLLPHFAKELAYGRKTYNARSETVASLPTFRDSWRRGRRCIIPAESIYEPSWETGKAVRWRIGQHGDVPMGIAGVYAKTPGHLHGDDKDHFSFAMLTVNADGHLVMQRFHRPGEEKRMVVILDPAEYDAWLFCSVDEAPRFFLRWEGELVTQADPLIRPAIAPKVLTRPSRGVDPESGELF